MATSRLLPWLSHPATATCVLQVLVVENPGDPQQPQALVPVECRFAEGGWGETRGRGEGGCRL
jgi:hypothetical protein